MAVRLTDAIARTAKAPADRSYVIHYDSICRGFGLRITRLNSRSWVLNYRAAGRERRMTIGAVPVWSCGQARERAMALKRQIDSGGDPLTEAREERAAPTIADLCERYRLEHMLKKRPRSRLEDWSMITQWVLPELGTRKVTDVHRRDVEQLHRKVSRDTPIRANRLLALTSKMMSLAVRWELRETNPCIGVERNREEPRERYLSGAEIERLVETLRTWPNQQTANIVRLALLTGSRKGEILGMAWREIDFEQGVWIKPAPRVKQAKLHRVPLSQPVRQLLAELQAASSSPFVFPSATAASKHTVDPQRDWSRIRKAAELANFRMHDLRHSFASTLAGDGASLLLIGSLLGHASSRTTERYAHLSDDPQRQATERAAAILGAVETNVVKIRR